MFLPDPSGHRDVALGLCRTAGRVLLVWNARSAQGLAERFWDLPGGTVEPGEGLAEALAREWEEAVRRVEQKHAQLAPKPRATLVRQDLDALREQLVSAKTQAQAKSVLLNAGK